MTIFLLCIKIFFARILDVTLGTIRTIHTVKGRTLIAGLIAFVEVFIWFVVVREALNTELDSIWIVVSYSAGYATGTMLGTLVSKSNKEIGLKYFSYLSESFGFSRYNMYHPFSSSNFLKLSTSVSIKITEMYSF